MGVAYKGAHKHKKWEIYHPHLLCQMGLGLVLKGVIRVNHPYPYPHILLEDLHPHLHTDPAP